MAAFGVRPSGRPVSLQPSFGRPQGRTPNFLQRKGIDLCPRRVSVGHFILTVRNPAPAHFAPRNNSSAWARALFAFRSPSIRASSLTRALRFFPIGEIVTNARSFD